MRFAIAAMWAAFGCAPPRARPDAGPPDGPPDAGIDAAFVERRPTADVLVGADRVAWTQVAGGCPLESGPECPPIGPSISTADLVTGAPSTWFADRDGAWSIAGDQDQLFIAVGPDWGEGYIAEVRPAVGGDVVTFAAGAGPAFGVAVDADYVYWATAPTGGPIAVRRAARGGDGSDAVTLATTPVGPLGLTVSAGWVWWAADAVYRVPVTGGTPAIVLDDGQPAPRILAATTTAVYVVRYDDATPWGAQIAAIAGDGSLTMIVDHMDQHDAPTYGVIDDDELFFAMLNGGIADASLTTGDVRVVSGTDQVRDPFGVTPTELLVDFTRDGFRRVPR